MKACLKILSYMGIIVGLLGLFLLLSFTNNTACQIANSGVLSIRVQTQHALETNELEMARYHTFKALGSLEKNKNNLNDCGCEPALVTTREAEQSLKMAARSTSLEDAKGFLKIALENTMIAIDALKNYGEEFSNTYGDDILVMNTTEAVHQKSVSAPHSIGALQQKMNQSLSAFEISLQAVVEHVECTEAANFIHTIFEKSDRALEKGTLTEGQRQYHARVKIIAHNALMKLEDCSPN